MNLFEDWDATEKRNAKKPQTVLSRAGTAGTAPGLGTQLQAPPTSRDVNNSRKSPPPQQQQQQRRSHEGGLERGGSATGSTWGQRSTALSPQPTPVSSSASVSARSSASISGPNNPFSSKALSSTNPFGSSANPFGGAGPSPNPFASSTLGATSSTVIGETSRSQSGFQPSLGPAKHGEPPMFSLQRLDFSGASASRRAEKFRAASASWSILTVAVGNGTTAMATSDCCVIRWNADRDAEAEEIEISKRQEDTIHRIFLDPTGNHLLACLHGGETFYLHSSTLRPKRLVKWSGVVVESVAFDAQRCTEGSTKGIVVGTRSGDLYESSLESNGKERPFSLVYSLAHRQSGSRSSIGDIMGGGSGRIDSGTSGASGAGARASTRGGDGGVVAALHLESISSAIHGETRVFLMAVTASPLRLYLFMGGPTLEVMFREHRESSSTSFRELPGTMLGTELHVYRRPLGAGPSAKLGDAGGSGGSSRGRLGVLGHKEAPQSFGLLTSMGIYHGSLALGNQATLDNVIAEAQLVPYPEGNEAEGSSSGSIGAPAPISMAITEFHFLLLYTDRLQVVNRLNSAVVQEEILQSQDPGVGHVLTMVTDPFTGGGAMQAASPVVNVAHRLWLFTDRLPFKVRVSHEDRDVWMLFLEKALAGEEGHFDSAAHHCKNATERAQVHYVQAGWYFRRGQHTLAARYYAKTPCCFEEIALKFMECEEGWKATALKTYLLERLRHLSLKQGEQKMQRTMLCTWLTELYLRGFTYLRLHPGTDQDRADAEFSLAEELRSFLRGHSAALDPATTLALLSTHGRAEEALFYATLVEDYDRVLAHHANNGPDYKAALDVLRKAPFDKVEPLVYKYSASLMKADPKGTIDTWMSKPQLKPTKLIPALVRYSQRRMTAMLRSLSDLRAQQKGSKADVVQRHQDSSPLSNEDLAIKYLEFCVNELKLKDPAIHNHLLALYAQEEEWREKLTAAASGSAKTPSGTGTGDEMRTSIGAYTNPAGSVERDQGMTSSGNSSSSRGSSSALLAFIARPADERFFDPMYALRLCSQHGRSLACVHLYSAMGLWEEAVDLALTVDTNMAKANANKAPDPETRKLLWLKIARRQVERCRSADIEDTMRVLQECELLKIEDILPFFPDFVVIDSFKREICVSLEEYNGKIESLRKEMDDYTLTTEAVQSEIMDLKQRSMYVSSNQTCELCGRNILSTQFYVFPCSHAFHADCLMDNIRPHLSKDQQAAVTSLLAVIAEGGSSQPDTALAATGSSNVKPGVRGLEAAAINNGGEVDASKRAQHYLRSLQSELDGYVAAECVLCGDIMVQSVDKPLVTPQEHAEQSHEWAL